MKSTQQATARAVFMGGLAMVISASLLMTQESLQPAHLPDFVHMTPGLYELATGCSFPLAAVTGVLLALCAAVGFAFAARSCKEVTTTFLRRLDHLTSTQRLLYALIGLLVAIAPIFVVTIQRNHMGSSWFFRLVATEPIALSVFCAGLYIFNCGIFLFASSLLGRSELLKGSH
ncbi:hypothetical protein [Caenimonas aquaedulcis]|uniref:Uncharacterized protein n=1 Tax=Caenimonas aquaedulcis TaxID=2793270 RepID=A0A931MGW9_9BURK|nr:hypothetical protein [Caenimonas aquaedulcis]MBG9388546.1 hypothetical protein [Caenimonas aquaedulcis]